MLYATAAKGDVLGELPVQDGKRQTVALTVSEDLKVLAPKNRENDLQLVVADEKSLTAPVEQGTEAATLLVQLDGETLLSKPLVTAEAVPRANFFVRIFRSIIAFIRGLIKRV